MRVREMRSGNVRGLSARAARSVVSVALMACAPASGSSSTRDARVTDSGNAEQLDAAESEPDADAESETSEQVDAAAHESPVRDAAAPREDLVIHEFWSLLAASEDPFDDRPADAGCKPSGVMAELLADERVFSVDTGFCGYLTVHQPTLRAVAQGESIKVRLWHFELSAPQPASAHAAVMVDGLHVLDEQLAIPSAGGLLTRELVAPRAIPAGAQVYFHLHNHGSNSWSLVEVSAGPR